MNTRIWIAILALLFVAPVAAQAQAVLFDGWTHDQGDKSILMVPGSITTDDYGVFGRLEYGFRDRVNIFGEVGARFNGGSTALVGGGWEATIYRQSEELGVNIGIFNSYLFPLESGGPDVLVTISPVFSRTWLRKSGRRGRITPYFGVATTILAGNTPPGLGFGRRTTVNALAGLKLTNVGNDLDFVGEIQAGEQFLFAFGFNYRF